MVSEPLFECNKFSLVDSLVVGGTFNERNVITWSYHEREGEKEECCRG